LKGVLTQHGAAAIVFVIGGAAMTDRRVVIDLNAVRHEADKKMELGALRYIVAMWALIPAMLTQESAVLPSVGCSTAPGCSMAKF
jgi:hypothetical protein